MLLYLEDIFCKGNTEKKMEEHGTVCDLKESQWILKSHITDAHQSQSFVEYFM